MEAFRNMRRSARIAVGVGLLLTGMALISTPNILAVLPMIVALWVLGVLGGRWAYAAYDQHKLEQEAEGSGQNDTTVEDFFRNKFMEAATPQQAQQAVKLNDILSPSEEKSWADITQQLEQDDTKYDVIRREDMTLLPKRFRKQKDR